MADYTATLHGISCDMCAEERYVDKSGGSAEEARARLISEGGGWARLDGKDVCPVCRWRILAALT